LLVAVTAVFGGEKWWRARSGALEAWADMVDDMDDMGRAIADSKLDLVNGRESAFRTAAQRLEHDIWVVGPRSGAVRRVIADLRRATKLVHQAAEASDRKDAELSFRAASALLQELRGMLPAAFGSVRPRRTAMTFRSLQSGQRAYGRLAFPGTTTLDDLLAVHTRKI
jgi:hypothetical protein